MTTRLIINRGVHILGRTQPSFITAEKFMKQCTRNSSYKSSKPVESPEAYTGVEVSKLPEEWKYVERLFPSTSVPVPKPKAEYPSGWRPPTEAAVNQPYYIDRNRNHMYPVYLKTGYRGHKRTTQIKRIHGDIWLLQDDLKDYLEKRSGKYMYLQVHEVCRQINIKGDYVSIVQEWLQDKGF